MMPKSIVALKKNMTKLYLVLKQDMKKKFKRDLPFYELLFDRWERAKALRFGEKTSIYQSSYIYGDVKVGKNTWIGPFTVLDGSGGLEIGDNCSISAGVQIYSHNTVRWAVSGGKEAYEREPVKIGHNCFIGPLAVIKNGTRIGDHCVIGAHSYVNKNIPAHSIAVGCPIKIIGEVIVPGKGPVELRYYPAPK